MIKHIVPKNKKAQVTLYIVFIIAALFIVLVAAVFAPMGVLFNTRMYEAGEDILDITQADLDGIADTDVRASIDGMINQSKDAALFNIEVNNDLFQYSWILIVGMLALTIFIVQRRLVEVGGRGGFVG